MMNVVKAKTSAFLSLMNRPVYVPLGAFLVMIAVMTLTSVAITEVILVMIRMTAK